MRQYKNIIKGFGALVGIMLSQSAMAQIGAPFIHDPSTIVECDGKYYTFGTGGGGLISEDGWTWNSGAQRPGGGAAPDAMKIGDRYLVAYSATGGGLGGGHAGRILVMWNNTLDPESPDFKFSEPIEVARSIQDEDCDAIDAGLLLDPKTGRLWVTYGTYFGHIRMVEIDPKTGERVKGNKAKNVAIDCEASDLIYKDGYYYLLGTHGTCCDGGNSTYNIVCGRSKNVTGPFIDNVGRDMMEGGGRMVIAGSGRTWGAGHFGRYVVADGVEKMSLHWEADLDQGGRSVLAIRPIIWKNGWPVGGELFKEGTYEIESERRGYSLELVVDFVRMNRGGGMFGGMGGFGGFGGMGGAQRPAGAQGAAGAQRPANAQGGQAPAGGFPGFGGFGAGAPQGAGAQGAAGAQRPANAQGAQAGQAPAGGMGGFGGFGGMGGFGGGAAGGAQAQRSTQQAAPQPVASQTLADVIEDWPKGEIRVRMADYMGRPHQRWTITAVPEAGGYLGGPYYKIIIAGTNRALAATAEKDVTSVPKFTGAPEQLWRIDQCTDGTYRIMPKAVPGTDEELVLMSAGDCTPTLGKWDFNSDNCKWNFKDMTKDITVR